MADCGRSSTSCAPAANPCAQSSNACCPKAAKVCCPKTQTKVCPPIPKTVCPKPCHVPKPGECKKGAGPSLARTNFERLRQLSRPYPHRLSNTGELTGNPRRKGLGKRISTNTMHGVNSVNDLRAWGQSVEDRRRHFLEKMFQVQNGDDDEFDENVRVLEFKFLLTS